MGQAKWLPRNLTLVTTLVRSSTTQDRNGDYVEIGVPVAVAALYHPSSDEVEIIEVSGEDGDLIVTTYEEDKQLLEELFDLLACGE